jgi:hypothetical protein
VYWSAQSPVYSTNALPDNKLVKAVVVAINLSSRPYIFISTIGSKDL